ncbi:MAG: hypothetical protein KH386_00210 [Bacteroides sp.]|nr:hypothetical protein [Bacteroides sp.]
MRQNVITRLSFCFMLVMSLFACDKSSEVLQENGEVSISISSGIEQASSRAVVPYPQNVYKGRYYVYNSDGSYLSEGELASVLKINGLTSGQEYKVVLLAVPSGQQYGITTGGTESEPSYSDAKTQYQGDGTQYGYEIFRDVLTIKPTVSNTDFKAVLTRQNGAIEIRIRNMQLQEVTLRVNGTQYMYFHDGTGGEVISDKELTLNRTLTSEQLTSSETRIRINLLPQEDITDDNGDTNFLKITTTSGTETTYPLKSSEGSIPIYPNQVTWLTLGDGGEGSEGGFNVDFSGSGGGIHLEDDIWDGWQDNY